MKNLKNSIKKFKACAEGETIYQRPNKNLISSYQKKINYNFCEDYKIFLEEVSNFYRGSIDILDLTENFSSPDELLKQAKIAWELGVSRDQLPFAIENGDYFCIDKEGIVHFWSHNGVTDETWPNLATWIEEEWSKEWSKEWDKDC